MNLSNIVVNLTTNSLDFSGVNFEFDLETSLKKSGAVIIE